MKPTFEIVSRESGGKTVYDVQMNNRDTGEGSVIIGGLGSRLEAGAVAAQVFAALASASWARDADPDAGVAELMAKLKGGKAS